VANRRLRTDGVHRQEADWCAAEGKRGFARCRAQRNSIISRRIKTQNLTASFAEMRQLGIHYDSRLYRRDYNPDNPNIGRVKRSYPRHRRIEAMPCWQRSCARAADWPVPEALSASVARG